MSKKDARIAKSELRESIDPNRIAPQFNDGIHGSLCANTRRNFVGTKTARNHAKISQNLFIQANEIVCSFD